MTKTQNRTDMCNITQGQSSHTYMHEHQKPTSTMKCCTSAEVEADEDKKMFQHSAARVDMTSIACAM